MHENFITSSDPFSVRRFEANNRDAVLALWPADVIDWPPGPENIDVLISSVGGAIAGKHHVWVAEAYGRITGSAAVIHNGASLAHLQFLCVASDFTDGHVIARGLAETAIRDVLEFYQNLYERPRRSD
jgi:hypothetical protein